MKPIFYYYLVMPLRDKDVMATFNWDSFLIKHGARPFAWE